MDETRKSGRVTIPTDLDVVPETLEILKKWGADAIRDCDGTDFPQQLKDADAKIYSTYYTTRKDNAWAKANPDIYQREPSSQIYRCPRSLRLRQLRDHPYIWSWSGLRCQHPIQTDGS